MWYVAKTASSWKFPNSLTEIMSDGNKYKHFLGLSVLASAKVMVKSCDSACQRKPEPK